MQTYRFKVCYNILCKQILLPGAYGEGFVEQHAEGGIILPYECWKIYKERGIIHAGY